MRRAFYRAIANLLDLGKSGILMTALIEKDGCLETYKALLEMCIRDRCLPYLLENAESFSNNVFAVSPNAILVLDEQLRIQRMNMPACHMFGIARSQEVIGTSVIDLIDPTEFQSVLDTGNDIIDKKIYIPEYDLYVELSVVLDAEHHSLFGIFKDITAEHNRREKYIEKRAKTIDITDKVIEKQRRIVQEIASLLGETTAETKIALSQIKNIVRSEDE